jgi:hypothetical protein
MSDHQREQGHPSITNHPFLSGYENCVLTSAGQLVSDQGANICHQESTLSRRQMALAKLPSRADRIRLDSIVASTRPVTMRSTGWRYWQRTKRLYLDQNIQGVDVQGQPRPNQGPPSFNYEQRFRKEHSLSAALTGW